MSRSGRGEFEIIERLRQRCRTAPTVPLGIGDDCAILAPPAGEQLLTTTDLLVEGVHFRRDWSPPGSLGRKAAAVNLSDLAAMGATPRALLLGLAIPVDFSDAELDSFLDGFLEVCHGAGAVLAGGDTCASAHGLTLSVTALGSAPPAEIVRRAGAAPGDGIYVSGRLGDSALALRQLAAGEQPAPELLRAHLEPQARTALGRELARAGVPSAMIDLSDGLLADLGHILAASQVGARIDVGLLPLSAALSAVVSASADSLHCALCGGEDYELLFTAPDACAPTIERLAEAQALALTRIGSIRPGAATITLEQEGRPYPLPAQTGYKHFSDGA